MRDPRIILVRRLLRARNRWLGLDQYTDPWSYFDSGGLAEAEALCARANRDLPAFVRPPERVAPAGLQRDGRRVRSDAVRVEQWSFDSAMPSGDAANDRVRFRLYVPPAGEQRRSVVLFHHPLYQRRWPIWSWFLALLIRRVPVAILAGPYHFERRGAGRFPGEGTMNPNPARLFLALRQWCWDHEAVVAALGEKLGLRTVAEIGYSLGAFQTLLLAAAGRVDVPIVAISSTNRYAFGLTRGALGDGLLRSMRQVGIDEPKLWQLTKSVQLERHVAPLRGKPVLNIRGINDWVDPAPSLQRLEAALQPARSLHLFGGHSGLVFRRERILREVIRFFEEVGALPPVRRELGFDRRQEESS